MERYVSVGRIRIEALAEHQHRLAMLVPAAAQERDVGRQRDITGDFLPDELEGIRPVPYVLAAAADVVALFGLVVLSGAGVKNGADIGVAFKNADRTRRVLRAKTTRGTTKKQANDACGKPSCAFVFLVHGKTSRLWSA